MSRDQLEELLRKWGRWFGEPPPSEWDEDSSGSAGRLTDMMMRHMRVGVEAVGPDPILGEVVRKDRTGNFHTVNQRLTAKGKESKGGARPWLPDPEADQVELAWLDLLRYDRDRNGMMAVVLRMEYCARGRQREKAQRTSECLKERISLRRYRWELEHAREWMCGRLFGRKAA